MDYPFKHRLIAMAAADRKLVSEGAAADRLSALREANARELELIVDEDGWPTTEEAGPEGTEAALALAMNAQSRPSFMRRCLTLMKGAVNRGDLPAEHCARLDALLKKIAD